jgi:hypothetical protein
LPCVFPGARQRASHVVSSRRRQLLFLPCAVKKRTTKIIYRALSDTAHGNGALPCEMLPCALCRWPRRKTHDKEFAMRFRAFAVRPWGTTNPLFPVVYLGNTMSNPHLYLAQINDNKKT